MKFRINSFHIGFIFCVACVLGVSCSGNSIPSDWKYEWSKTDFSKSKVPFHEIVSGGVSKDRIAAIDDPKFVKLNETDLKDTSPVIGLVVNKEAKAYPIESLIYHEIVNDVIGGEPVAVTYCPLCNTAIVFKRRINGKDLKFGVSGKLRHSDMIMFDRETESWWQQFTGEAIVGEYTGAQLEVVASRLESFASFKERTETTMASVQVLYPKDPFERIYGTNPYKGYDSREEPIFDVVYSKEKMRLLPMTRVVMVGNHAWPLELLKSKGMILYGDWLISWTPGQNSALDTALIQKGRDVGNVVVQKRDGVHFIDVPYVVTFAFAFRAFYPGENGILHLN